MTDDPPPNGGIDTTIPNVARVWDYQLGGKDNFDADRTAADALNKACRAVGAPDGTVVARENRDFIRRAVGNDNTTVITVDLRHRDEILHNPGLVALIDLTKPVAVLLVAVLHLLPDDENPAGIVAQLRDAIAPGSYLAVTHVTSDARPELAAKVADEFARLRITTPLIPRTRHEIGAFFNGFDLVEPGLVFPTRWNPIRVGDDPGAQWMYAGVGRKPTHDPARVAESGDR